MFRHYKLRVTVLGMTIVIITLTRQVSEFLIFLKNGICECEKK